jgi:PBP1b-binding outer membrane lipoprotein LpoB
MIKMNTRTMKRVLVAALGLALLLPACSKTESSSGAPASGGDDAAFDEALEAEPIPSQDVADAAAEEEITEANADSEFEALKAEIEKDN